MNGGDWNNGANAGLRALNLNNPASNANWNIGARPANEKLARRGAKASVGHACCAVCSMPSIQVTASAP